MVDFSLCVEHEHFCHIVELRYRGVANMCFGRKMDISFYSKSLIISSGCYAFFSAKADREYAILNNPILGKLAEKGNTVALNLILTAGIASSTRSMRTAQVDAVDAVDASKAVPDEAGSESSSSDSE